MHQWNRKHIFLPLSTAGPKVPFVSAEALLPQILDASCQQISTHVLCIGCIWVQSAKSPGSGLRWIFNRLVLPQNSTAFKRQTHNQFAWQMRFILLVWGPSLDKPLLRQSAKKKAYIANVCKGICYAWKQHPAIQSLPEHLDGCPPAPERLAVWKWSKSTQGLHARSASVGMTLISSWPTLVTSIGNIWKHDSNLYVIYIRCHTLCESCIPTMHWVQLFENLLFYHGHTCLSKALSLLMSGSNTQSKHAENWEQFELLAFLFV